MRSIMEIQAMTNVSLDFPRIHSSDSIGITCPQSLFLAIVLGVSRFSSSRTS